MTSGLHTWSKTAASNATADDTVGWSEGQAPSSINNSARAMMAVVAKWRDDNNGTLTTGGTATAFTLTSNTVFTSLALMTGQTLAFTMHTTSGATPTLNVDSLGAKVIRNVTGVALPTGALLSGAVYHAKYDNSSGEWLLLNQAGVIPTSSVATASIADDAVTFAKMQNSTGSALIGKNDAGSGDFKEITLGSGLTFSGTTIVGVTNPNELYGYLSGLELSTAGSSSTFAVAAGAANDVSLGGLMYQTSSISKTTSSWAVGSGNGGLDTGAIATSTWYHVYLIKRTDTGVVDVLFSTSASSPTMPTSYTLKRRIGSMKTNGSSQWTSFTQYGDTFIWAAMATDSGTAGTSRSSLTVTVPTGVVVEALGRPSTAAGGTNQILFTALVEADVAPTTTLGDLSQQASGGSAFMRVAIFTNTSAQVGMRSSAAGTGIAFLTYGWRDLRGK